MEGPDHSINPNRSHLDRSIGRLIEAAALPPSSSSLPPSFQRPQRKESSSALARAIRQSRSAEACGKRSRRGLEAPHIHSYIHPRPRPACYPCPTPFPTSHAPPISPGGASASIDRRPPREGAKEADSRNVQQEAKGFPNTNLARRRRGVPRLLIHLQQRSLLRSRHPGAKGACVGSGGGGHMGVRVQPNQALGGGAPSCAGRHGHRCIV